MQILSSGSFINLESQEKIEQLIFTAKAIADSAVETDGFASGEENNKKLALEIFQGAEYMTREHERARIQNIFISNFLERLRETGAVSAKANNLPESFDDSAANPSLEADVRKDEFLGFVTAATESESRQTSQADDRFAEMGAAANPIQLLAPNSETMAIVQEENFETPAAKSVESTAKETPEIEGIESEIVEVVEPNRESEAKTSGVPQNEKDEKPAIGAITLSEKEPYRWDDCTVTATIQLLPVESETRKVVVSVRTHDFAPQISVVELGGAATPEQISPALEKAFERYKTDLPVKVMDKMKREKSAGKKQASKSAVETKTSSSITNSTVGSETKSEAKLVQTSVTKSENNQTASTVVSATQSAASQATSANRSKPSAKISKPETSAQGNLFGF